MLEYSPEGEGRCGREVKGDLFFKSERARYHAQKNHSFGKMGYSQSLNKITPSMLDGLL